MLECKQWKVSVCAVTQPANITGWNGIYTGYTTGTVDEYSTEGKRIGKLRPLIPALVHPLINRPVPPCSLNTAQSLCASEPISSRGIAGSVVPTKLYFQILR
jgi:hypothetical protein